MQDAGKRTAGTGAESFFRILRRERKLCLMIFFLFLFLVDLFQNRLVRQRHIAFHTPVVKRILLAVFQVDEQPAQVNRAADGEPDRGNRGDNAGDNQGDNEEVVSPPFHRPRRNSIIKDYQQERKNKLVAERLEEHGPGDDSVAACVFRGDADQFGKYIPESPCGLDVLLSVDAVNAAVEHTVQIERPAVGDP